MGISFPLLAVLASMSASVAVADNSLIDFGKVGYKYGQPLPQVTGVPTVLLFPNEENDAARIQAAIDLLARQPLTPSGYRGVIKLTSGIYEIDSTISISASGIILQGDGNTQLHWTSRRRGPILMVEGGQPSLSDPLLLSSDAETGEQFITLSDVSAFTVGDRIQIQRPSRQNWIEDLRMNVAKGHFVDKRLHWRENGRNLYWIRSITAVDSAAHTLSLDAPVTYPIRAKYGGGSVRKYLSNPITNIGIEGLLLVGGTKNDYPQDENHAWDGIQIDYAEDVWIRNIQGTKLVGALVRTSPKTRKVTVEACEAYDFDGESAGYRRQAFYLEGQLCLVMDCCVERGRNDYVSGLCTAGPNVFYRCRSIRPEDASGAWESFTVGTLFDSIDLGGGSLFLGLDTLRTQGAGWTAVNCVVAGVKRVRSIVLDAPETSPNIYLRNSLYMQQRPTGLRPELLKFEVSLPVPEPQPSRKTPVRRVEIVDGRFVLDGKTLYGGMTDDVWWQGDVSPGRATANGISILRFIPGKYGAGHIENLSQLADDMIAHDCHFYHTGPGLWYDRRRDEHLITERTNSYVWAPFYELPWSRTGQGKAFDGMSLYDLSTFNDYYYQRIADFAQVCDERGIVLYYNFYNTHNILEIGAHWCDYPARPVNCINPTQIPEPMPLEPRDRLHIANDYYTVRDTALLRLHKRYIEHTLNCLAGYENIFFNIGFQYSGNADFARFVYRTIYNWQLAHGRKVRVQLCVSKDVTDAILEEPDLRSMVEVVDMRYWQYRPDGSLWAPKGGRNRAYREVNTEKFGTQGDSAPKTTPYMAYKQVREYHDRYPGIAFVPWHNDVTPLPAVMAGAGEVLYSYNRIFNNNPFDRFVAEQLPDLYTMQPVDGIAMDAQHVFTMQSAKGEAVLLYSTKGSIIRLARPLDGYYKVVWYQPESGLTYTLETEIRDNLYKPDDRPWLAVIRR